MRSKLILNISLVILIIIIIFTIIAIFTPGEYILLLFPKYREIESVVNMAREYRNSDPIESLNYYKKAMDLSLSYGLRDTKMNIVSEIYTEFPRNKLLYEFCHEILLNQYIENKGMKYKYSVAHLYGIIDPMLEIDTTQTLQIFMNIPHDAFSKNEELNRVWEYHIKPMIKNEEE